MREEGEEGGRKERRRRKGRWVGIDSSRSSRNRPHFHRFSLITRERHSPSTPPSFSSLLHSGQLALATNLQAFNINATRYIRSNPTVVSLSSLSSSLSLCLCFCLCSCCWIWWRVGLRPSDWVYPSVTWDGMLSLSFSLSFSLQVPLWINPERVVFTCDRRGNAISCLSSGWYLSRDVV